MKSPTPGGRGARVRLPGGPWKAALGVFAFWTLLGIASATQAWLSSAVEGRPAAWGEALVRTLPGWWFWAVATAAVVPLTRRFPFERDRWPGSLVVHLAAAVVAAFLRAALFVALLPVVGETGTPPFSTRQWLQLVFLGRLNTDVLTWFAIVGAVTAWRFARRARDREVRAARLETRLAEARLTALRGQLHPHFLFNSLNAVAAEVRAGRGTTAVRMLGDLGDLLRRAVDETRPVVPLEEELELAERYLAIERARFGERLRFEIDADVSTLEARVPVLLLQPLVENAVRHGIAPRGRGGRIEIRARRDHDRLRISIRDDGEGSDGPVREGVGLRNTRQRLEALYGTKAALRIADDRTGGTIVTLELPWRREPDAAADPEPDAGEGYEEAGWTVEET